MLESHQKLTGTRYTATAALAIAASVFSPAVLVLSRPFGQASIALAIGFSAACLALAWFHWRNHSRLTIPSFETPSARVK
ncbi:MAG: hypothetical protein IH602_15705 [Bryobacteraceae bacterium]|nr:hypothetical protein [Bryobacteraceae bacterium]